jgi:hypothetical protein
MVRVNAPLIQTRARQPTTGGLGVHFVSPVKRRDKRKTTTVVQIPGHRLKRKTLLRELRALMHQSSPSPPLGDPFDSSMPLDTADDDNPNMPDAANVHDADNMHDAAAHNQHMILESNDTVMRRITPNEEAYSLYDRWTSLLPSLVDSLLSYDKTSMGNLVYHPASIIVHSCSVSSCSRKTTHMTSLYFDRMLLLLLSGYK